MLWATFFHSLTSYLTITVSFYSELHFSLKARSIPNPIANLMWEKTPFGRFCLNMYNAIQVSHKNLDHRSNQNIPLIQDIFHFE